MTRFRQRERKEQEKKKNEIIITAVTHRKIGIERLHHKVQYVYRSYEE